MNQHRRVFIAGASGAVGRRLCRLLVADGFAVTGMTRSPDKVPMLHAAKERWEPMIPSEFGLWRGGAGDRHAATAKLVKQLSGKTGEPRVLRQEFAGDGAAASARNYSETESGIHLTLRWKGDALEVEWQGADTGCQVERVEIPFSERFRSEGESGKGGDAGVD
jgi:NAD(P)-dependent dehydrogenase (short-subunit alcohol dehydrogenase family)